MSKPKFELGKPVATPGCLTALAESGQSTGEFLSRHQAGDWGEVKAEDAAANDAALLDGGRIMSAYRLATGVRIWVISEAVGDDGRREATCMLLPEEY